MITVRKPWYTNVDPEDQISYAAKLCRTAVLPEMGVRIDNEKQLFKKSHHTTYQHFYLTFRVDGIAVGDVTLGLHLCSPFYNTDQRSGRNCAEMFVAPDFAEIENYIMTFWPKLDRPHLDAVMAYIRKGVGIYQNSLPAAADLAKRLIKEERPKASEQYIDRAAPGIAQEQMRMFIPVIFPTGLVFTVNLSALAALYRAAWTPPLRFVIGEMVSWVRQLFPGLDYMVKNTDDTSDWAPMLKKILPEYIRIKHRPELELLQLDNLGFIAPDTSDMHPVDLLHFKPQYMENNCHGAKLRVEVSLATMGQDQRHRTIARGMPSFTGDFYLPPIPWLMGMKELAKKYMSEWLMMFHKLPRTLSAAIAPYGAIMSYIKQGSYNAIGHEQVKRLCFCTQEEIYNLNRKFRLNAIGDLGRSNPLMQIFEPGCFKTGVCAEGGGYCGRDISLRNSAHYFPERQV